MQGEIKHQKILESEKLWFWNGMSSLMFGSILGEKDNLVKYSFTWVDIVTQREIEPPSDYFERVIL